MWHIKIEFTVETQVNDEDYDHCTGVRSGYRFWDCRMIVGFSVTDGFNVGVSRKVVYAGQSPSLTGAIRECVQSFLDKQIYFLSEPLVSSQPMPSNWVELPVVYEFNSEELEQIFKEVFGSDNPTIPLQLCVFQ